MRSNNIHTIILSKINLFIEYYGIRFIIFISLIFHFLKGFIFGGGSSGLIGAPFLYIMRDYKYLNATRIQLLKGLSLLPWALKPLFGLLSDVLLINGYHKIYYMIIVSIISSISSFLIFLLWIDLLIPEILTLLFVFIYISIAFNDLLVEAKYTEKIKENPEIGSTLVSYVYGGLFIGEMLSIIFSGLIIKYDLKKLNYLLTAIPLFLIIIPIWLNWLNDPRKETKYPLHLDINKIKSEWKLCILSLFICFMTIIAGALVFFKLETKYYLLFSIICGIAIIIVFNVLFPPIYAKIQTFFIIQNMFSVSIEAGSFFFFTDDEISYPDGPHFSQFFYITVIGIVGSIFGLLGILLYRLFMTKWKYRQLFIVNNILYMTVSLLNIIIYKRWNIYMGISDKLFIIGAETCQHVIGVWNTLPMILLTSHLCRNGMEATTYALIAGTSNLGTLLSQYQGAFLLDILKINPNGGIDDFLVFDNLWIASLISAILPCIPIFLVPYLIPDSTPDEKIEENI
jgi:hypothetical protein